jgi:hypothetical protein
MSCSKVLRELAQVIANAGRVGAKIVRAVGVDENPVVVVFIESISSDVCTSVDDE